MLLGAFALAAATGAIQAKRQTWTGHLIAPEGVNPGIAADTLELQVLDLTGDAELAELQATLQSGGQAALHDAMIRLEPKGWIRIGRRVQGQVTVIRVSDQADGRRVVRVLSDQPLRLYDKNDPPDSMAHPFGFLELVVDASGAGSGMLIAATSVAISAEGLRFESAGTPLIRVVDVTTDAPPTSPAD